MATKGICTLCGKGGTLSFEHVPPKASLNVPDVQMHTFDDWLNRLEDGTLPGGLLQPEGTGLKGLCVSCNRFLGQHFVNPFAFFVHAGMGILHDIGIPCEELDRSAELRDVECEIRDVDCLAVAKQIVAMIVTTSGREFAEQHETLCSFVLDPERRGLERNYGLHLSLCCGPLARSTGLQSMGNTKTQEYFVFAEVAYYPFSYVLTVNGSDGFENFAIITPFIDAEPHVRRPVRLLLPIGFANTGLPGDMRSSALIALEAKGAGDAAN
jgi:hypothetical protein